MKGIERCRTMWIWLSQSFRYYNTFVTESVLCPSLQSGFFVLHHRLDSLYWTQSAWESMIVNNSFNAYILPSSHLTSRLFLYIIHSQTRPRNSKEPRRPKTSRIRLPQHSFLAYKPFTPTTYIMSRYGTHLSAPGMSSGRSRGSSLGQGGFSYTTQTTTTQTMTVNSNGHSGNRTYSDLNGGLTCPNGHLCTISEDGYDSDSCDSDSSDDTVVGRFSNMRLGGRTDSELGIRGPRLIELSDSRSRTSHRPSESSRVSHRPSESSRTSHRPAESHYSTARPTDSHRRSTITSSRPAESRTYGAGKEVTVYAEPSSNGKVSTDKTKPSRRDSKAMRGIKALVKHIWSVGKSRTWLKERQVIENDFRQIDIWWKGV